MSLAVGEGVDASERLLRMLPLCKWRHFADRKGFYPVDCTSCAARSDGGRETAAVEFYCLGEAGGLTSFVPGESVEEDVVAFVKWHGDALVFSGGHSPTLHAAAICRSIAARARRSDAAAPRIFIPACPDLLQALLERERGSERALAPHAEQLASCARDLAEISSASRAASIRPQMITTAEPSRVKRFEGPTHRQWYNVCMGSTDQRFYGGTVARGAESVAPATYDEVLHLRPSTVWYYTDRGPPGCGWSWQRVQLVEGGRVRFLTGEAGWPRLPVRLGPREIGSPVQHRRFLVREPPDLRADPASLTEREVWVHQLRMRRTAPVDLVRNRAALAFADRDEADRETAGILRLSPRTRALVGSIGSSTVLCLLAADAAPAFYSSLAYAAREGDADLLSFEAEAWRDDARAEDELRALSPRTSPALGSYRSSGGARVAPPAPAAEVRAGGSVRAARSGAARRLSQRALRRSDFVRRGDGLWHPRHASGAVVYPIDRWAETDGREGGRELVELGAVEHAELLNRICGAGQAPGLDAWRRFLARHRDIDIGLGDYVVCGNGTRLRPVQYTLGPYLDAASHREQPGADFIELGEVAVRRPLPSLAQAQFERVAAGLYLSAGGETRCVARMLLADDLQNMVVGAHAEGVRAALGLAPAAGARLRDAIHELLYTRPGAYLYRTRMDERAVAIRRGGDERRLALGEHLYIPLKRRDHFLRIEAGAALELPAEAAALGAAEEAPEAFLVGLVLSTFEAQIRASHPSVDEEALGRAMGAFDPEAVGDVVVEYPGGRVLRRCAVFDQPRDDPPAAHAAAAAPSAAPAFASCGARVDVRDGQIFWNFGRRWRLEFERAGRRAGRPPTQALLDAEAALLFPEVRAHDAGEAYDAGNLEEELSFLRQQGYVRGVGTAALEDSVAEAMAALRARALAPSDVRPFDICSVGLYVRDRCVAYALLANLARSSADNLYELVAFHHDASSASPLELRVDENMRRHGVVASGCGEARDILHCIISNIAAYTGRCVVSEEAGQLALVGDEVGAGSEAQAGDGGAVWGVRNVVAVPADPRLGADVRSLASARVPALVPGVTYRIVAATLQNTCCELQLSNGEALTLPLSAAFADERDTLRGNLGPVPRDLLDPRVADRTSAVPTRSAFSSRADEGPGAPPLRLRYESTGVAFVRLADAELARSVEAALRACTKREYAIVDEAEGRVSGPHPLEDRAPLEREGAAALACYDDRLSAYTRAGAFLERLPTSVQLLWKQARPGLHEAAPSRGEGWIEPCFLTLPDADAPSPHAARVAALCRASPHSPVRFGDGYFYPSVIDGRRFVQVVEAGDGTLRVRDARAPSPWRSSCLVYLRGVATHNTGFRSMPVAAAEAAAAHGSVAAPLAHAAARSRSGPSRSQPRTVGVFKYERLPTTRPVGANGAEEPRDPAARRLAHTPPRQLHAVDAHARLSPGGGAFLQALTSECVEIRARAGGLVSDRLRGYTFVLTGNLPVEDLATSIANHGGAMARSVRATRAPEERQRILVRGYDSRDTLEWAKPSGSHRPAAFPGLINSDAVADARLLNAEGGGGCAILDAYDVLHLINYGVVKAWAAVHARPERGCRVVRRSDIRWREASPEGDAQPIFVRAEGVRCDDLARWSGWPELIRASGIYVTPRTCIGVEDDDGEVRFFRPDAQEEAHYVGDFHVRRAGRGAFEVVWAGEEELLPLDGFLDHSEGRGGETERHVVYLVPSRVVAPTPDDLSRSGSVASCRTWVDRAVHPLLLAYPELAHIHSLDVADAVAFASEHLGPRQGRPWERVVREDLARFRRTIPAVSQQHLGFVDQTMRRIERRDVERALELLFGRADERGVHRLVGEGGALPYEVQCAGSYRRGRTSCSRIDLLVAGPEEHMHGFFEQLRRRLGMCFKLRFEGGCEHVATDILYDPVAYPRPAAEPAHRAEDVVRLVEGSGSNDRVDLTRMAFSQAARLCFSTSTYIRARDGSLRRNCGADPDVELVLFNFGARVRHGMVRTRAAYHLIDFRYLQDPGAAGDRQLYLLRKACALLHRTGPAGFVRRMQAYAAARHYTLSEESLLFEQRPVAGLRLAEPRLEEAIFAELGLAYVQPADRRATDPLASDLEGGGAGARRYRATAPLPQVVLLVRCDDQAAVVSAIVQPALGGERDSRAALGGAGGDEEPPETVLRAEEALRLTHALVRRIAPPTPPGPSGSRTSFAIRPSGWFASANVTKDALEAEVRLHRPEVGIRYALGDDFLKLEAAEAYCIFAADPISPRPARRISFPFVPSETAAQDDPPRRNRRHAHVNVGVPFSLRPETHGILLRVGRAYLMQWRYTVRASLPARVDRCSAARRVQRAFVEASGIAEEDVRVELSTARPAPPDLAHVSSSGEAAALGDSAAPDDRVVIDVSVGAYTAAEPDVEAAVLESVASIAELRVICAHKTSRRFESPTVLLENRRCAGEELTAPPDGVIGLADKGRRIHIRGGALFIDSVERRAHWSEQVPTDVQGTIVEVQSEQPAGRVVVLGQSGADAHVRTAGDPVRIIPNPSRTFRARRSTIMAWYHSLVQMSLKREAQE